MATKKPATKGSKKNDDLISSTTSTPNAVAKSGKDVKKSMKDYAASTNMLSSTGNSTPKAEAKSGSDAKKSMASYVAATSDLSLMLVAALALSESNPARIWLL